MPRKKAGGNPVEKPVSRALTMPGKNGGTLKRGGVHLGSGRKPDYLRRAAREGLAKALPRFIEMANGAKKTTTKEAAQAAVTVITGVADADAIRAGALLEKIGMSGNIIKDDIRVRVDEMVLVITTLCATAGQPALGKKILDVLTRKVWK